MRTAIWELTRRLGLQPKPELYLVAPGVNWVLDMVARYIAKEVQAQFGLHTHQVQDVSKLFGQILHFSSLWDLAPHVAHSKRGRNVMVGTVFHGQKKDATFQLALENILTNHHKLAKLHTASKIMEERFLAWGVPRDKLVRIPLGVDLARFTPVSIEQKRQRQRELGIPEEALCIGSFHKDGVGMAEGLEPKMIKGPDIFLEVIAKAHRRHPLFVLLSAPARGYVKVGLERLGVPYKHVVLDDYLQIPRLYQALDVYLMTSREEGGPLGVLESLACGVPLVATRVGLAPDVVTNGESGLLTENEDVDALASSVIELGRDNRLAERLVQEGLQTIRAYDWPLIAARYYHEIYKPILDEIG